VKVVSANVGMPAEMADSGGSFMTGIRKAPIAGSVRVRALNLDGDGQADLTVHGGIHKAVYLYPSEHYPFWSEALGRQDLPWGSFGENLTISGLSEESISVGDQLGIGTVVLEVTQPRLPCFKLAAKFQRDDIIKRLLDSRRTGFYARVVQEGTLQAGDAIRLEEEPRRLTIRELVDLYLTKRPERSQIERALSLQALSPSWREHFQKI
jgi:MOSC domain-containing protein YiiM